MYRVLISPSVVAAVAVAAALAAPGVLAPAAARADGFGGFSADQSRYLVGRDRVCVPLATASPLAAPGAPASGGAVPAVAGAPRCELASPGQVAGLKFRRGIRQQGGQAAYDVSFRGNSMTVTARSEARVVLVWDAIDPIARVTAVYASEGGALLAVEYQSRAGGRMRTDTVGFVLPARTPAAPASHAGQEAGGQAGREAGRQEGDQQGGQAGTPPGSGDAARVTELLAQARRLDKKSARAAERAYRQVLEEAPDQPEAHYGLARSLARQKQPEATLDALRALAASRHPDAIVWQVEARFDRAFARLRADPGFRSATGLDGAGASPAGAKPLYDRLVGFSNTWEQPEIKCEQAQVVLELERLARTFRLRIVSRCGGYHDTTRLSGSWRITGADRAELVFPNAKGPEDLLSCRMESCPDGEACLRCGVDTDLSFTLRPVRR